MQSVNLNLSKFAVKSRQQKTWFNRKTVIHIAQAFKKIQQSLYFANSFFSLNTHCKKTEFKKESDWSNDCEHSGNREQQYNST